MSGMVKVTSFIISAGTGHGFSFRVRTWAEMKIWCVKSMFMLKVVSSEKHLGGNGLSMKLPK